jgi:AAA domain
MNDRHASSGPPWLTGSTGRDEPTRHGDSFPRDRPMRPNGGDAQEGPSRFALIRFGDFKPLDGDDYCVKGVLPSSGLAIFWGAPKCGKSFFVFDLLMHVALGWEYRGHRVRQGPVVYVCLEGARAFRKRREAFRLAKLNGENPPFFFIVNSLSLAADRQKLINDIRRQAGKDVPTVVCIDTLNRSLAGSENSDEDMSAYIKALTPSETPSTASSSSSITVATKPNAREAGAALEGRSTCKSP